MKEIKITPPDGYEIDKEASTFDCIKFKHIEKNNLTWNEIQIKNVGKKQYYLNSLGGISNCELTPNLEDYTTNVPTERIAEKIRALCQLYVIAEYYNEGWEPDWDNGDKAKYYPIFQNTGNVVNFDHWYTTSCSHPVFKSKEVLLAAYEANKEIFETALKP